MWFDKWWLEKAWLISTCYYSFESEYWLMVHPSWLKGHRLNTVNTRDIDLVAYNYHCHMHAASCDFLSIYSTWTLTWCTVHYLCSIDKSNHSLWVFSFNSVDRTPVATHLPLAWSKSSPEECGSLMKQLDSIAQQFKNWGNVRLYLSTMYHWSIM